jgi:hypothetical protein
MTLLTLIGLMGVVSVIELRVVGHRYELALKSGDMLNLNPIEDGEEMILDGTNTLHRPGCKLIEPPVRFVNYHQSSAGNYNLCPECCRNSDQLNTTENDNKQDK